MAIPIDPFFTIILDELLREVERIRASRDLPFILGVDPATASYKTPGAKCMYLQAMTHDVTLAIALRYGNVPVKVSIEVIGNIYIAHIQHDAVNPDEVKTYGVVHFEADESSTYTEDARRLEEAVLVEVYTLVEHEDDDD